MKYEFPDTYGQSCILVAIDSSLLPMIAGALRPFEQRYTWLSDADFEQGYNAFAALQASFMNNCLADLVESNNRIYRLLDTALNGVQYTASGDVPPVITPAIPAAPSLDPAVAPGLRARFERLVHLVDNLTTGRTFVGDQQNPGDPGLTDEEGIRERLRLMQGIINAGWFGIGGQPATLADLVNALRIGSGDQRDSVLTALDALQGASSGAVIFGTVKDLFTDTVDALGEGAIVATLVASTMAQAALMGLQAAQIDRLISAIDGGGTQPPDKNVIGLLDDLVEAQTGEQAPAVIYGAELSQIARSTAGILQTLGPLSSAPGGYTVRRLLAMMLTCICAEPTAIAESVCSSPASDPDALPFSAGATTSTFTQLSSSTLWSADFEAVLSSIPGATLIAGGALNGISLSGPKWYRITTTLNEAGLSARYRLEGQVVTIGPGPAYFFVPGSSTLQIQVIRATGETEPQATVQLDYCGSADPPASNAFPEQACMIEEAATRVVAWVRLGQIGGLFGNIVIADFGDMSHIGLTRNLDSEDVPYYTYGSVQSPPVEIEVCVAWNFEGDPARQYVLDGITTDPPAGFKPATQFSAVTGSDPITIPSNNPMMSQYRFRAAVELVSDQSPMPGLDMWLGEVSGAS